MSDYDSDLFEQYNPSGELSLEAAQTSSSQRRSARIALSEYESVMSQLKAHGVSPAPGLDLSQLQELVSLVAASDSPAASPASTEESARPATSGRGRKRSRSAGPSRPKKSALSRSVSRAATAIASTSKAGSAGLSATAAPAAAIAPPAAAAAAPSDATAPPAAAAAATAPPAAAAAPTAATAPPAAAAASPAAATAPPAAAAPPASAPPAAAASSMPQHDFLVGNLQTLVRSVQMIDSRLQALENNAGTLHRSSLPLPPPAISTAFQSHSLASAAFAPALGSHTFHQPPIFLQVLNKKSCKANT